MHTYKEKHSRGDMWMYIWGYLDALDLILLPAADSLVRNLLTILCVDRKGKY